MKTSPKKTYDLTSNFMFHEDAKLKSIDKKNKSNIKSQLARFALIETLAHSKRGAYGAPQRKNQSRIRITEQIDGEAIKFEIKKIYSESNALVGEIFIPVDPGQSKNIYINWTGTHSKATLVADLEAGGPGELSYRKNELKILSQINDAVGSVVDRTKGEKVNLVISGHSLGGALAQLNFHSIQRALTQNIFESTEVMANANQMHRDVIQAELEYRSSLNAKQKKNSHIPVEYRNALLPQNIGSVTIGTWNSAGVVKHVEDSSNKLAPIIAAAGVKLQGLFGMVGGDTVQRTSQGTVLSDVDPKAADVSLLKINMRLSGYYAKWALSLGLGILGAAAGLYVLGPPAAIVGGIAFSLIPMAKTTLSAHTSHHMEEAFQQNADVSSEELKFHLYQNDTPEGKNKIFYHLTNKSRFLQQPGVHIIQKGLHKAFRLGMKTPRSDNRQPNMASEIDEHTLDAQIATLVRTNTNKSKKRKS